jgi:hypothetical protein
MIAATARNSESPSAALNDRPPRLASNYKGRGHDPVIAVGMIMSRVVFSIGVLPPSSTAADLTIATTHVVA